MAFITNIFLPVALGLSMPFLATAADQSGEELYFETCAVCHGDDGAGAMPDIPDVTGPEGPLWKSDSELITTIMNGVERDGLPTPMPVKGGNDDLTPEKAKRVLDFMRREFGN